MRSASDGSRGAARTLTPVSCWTQYSSMCARRSVSSVSSRWRASKIVYFGRNRRAVDTSPNCRSRSTMHNRRRTVELEPSFDGLGQLLVVDRELQQVDSSGAHDVSQARVRSAAEGQHE